jgi:hypothetical protein
VGIGIRDSEEFELLTLLLFPFGFSMNDGKFSYRYAPCFPLELWCVATAGEVSTASNIATDLLGFKPHIGRYC